jgi:hypothetical protein
LSAFVRTTLAGLALGERDSIPTEGAGHVGDVAGWLVTLAGTELPTGVDAPGALVIDVGSMPLP